MANQKLDESVRGVFAISATPFTDDGAVDRASTDRMVEFYLESGVTGLTILGVMGEAPKMSPDESGAFCDQVLRRVDERVPVVVGVSAPGLSAIESLTGRVMDLGAAGIMVSPMAGLRTDEAIEGYFHMVCDALGEVPIVLQDYPPASGVHMSVPLLNKLFADLPSLISGEVICLADDVNVVISDSDPDRARAIQAMPVRVRPRGRRPVGRSAPGCSRPTWAWTGRAMLELRGERGDTR